MTSEYVPPSVGSDGFNCPACGAYAHQTWYMAGIAYTTHPTFDRDKAPERKFGKSYSTNLAGFGGPAQYSELTNVLSSECKKCGKLAVWLHDQLVWPMGSNLPPPNPELPDDVQSDYREAGAVAQYSPRSAAALLRLTVEKLCRNLVPKERDLNACIGALVKSGLSTEIQQALDYVRIVGNNAVHPGQMDISDDPETVATLFALVNLIADEMITRKGQIAELYASLPESAKSAIAQRDGIDPAKGLDKR